MAFPQGTIYWPGIGDAIYGSFTMNQGVTPSTCTLYVPPQRIPPAHSGTLTIAYGSTVIQWRGCKLDLITEDRDPDRGTTWALHILDRRWKWGYGAISGYYNQRTNAGDTELIVGTRRTPRQLAALCLDALGERNYDVRALPTDARPQIEWNYTNPAQALDQLCDQFGCVVTLKTNNRVVIERRGFGRPLPQDASQPGPLVIERNVTADPPERPDAIIVACAPTMIQLDLELEAVSVDTDGTVDKIENMSYWPWAGNAARDKQFADVPFFNNITERDNARDFAKQYIYKWYRIKTPITLPKLPGEKKAGEIKDLARILPLLTHQLVKTQGRNVRDRSKETDERFEVEVAVNKRQAVLRPRELSAIVFGVWFDDQETKTNRASKVDHTISHKESMKAQKEKGLYDRGFNIDTETGIVKFSDYVYMRDEREPHNPQPAKLFLRVAVNVRDPETMAFVSYQRERRNRGQRFNTPPRYQQKDELALKIVCQYRHDHSIRSVDTNERECAELCNHYLDAMEAEYGLKDPRAMTYAGFLPIDVDGAIAQVTWSVDSRGFATTRASRNREELAGGPSYKERQLFQRMQQAAKEQDRPGHAKKKLLDTQIKL